MGTKLRMRFACFSFISVLWMMSCVQAVRISPRPSYRLSLTHRDFDATSEAESSIPGPPIWSQRFATAMKRSAGRVAVFEQASRGEEFETMVYAAQGAFVTTAAIGSPPAVFTAVVDTGSDLVWTQCKPCISCFSQPDPIFDPASSSSFHNASCSDPLCKSVSGSSCRASYGKNLPCSFTNVYGDLSYSSGILARDTLTLRDRSHHSTALPNFGFGCGHSNEFSSFLGASGIIGLGQSPLSLIAQLDIPAFSYCLQTLTDPISKRSPMLLGPISAIVSSSSSTTVTTSIISNPFVPTLYYIGFKGISVGGKSLNIPSDAFKLASDGSGGMIIDSGTTLTYLVLPAYTKVVEAFKSSIKAHTTYGSDVGLDLCYNKTVEVPSLTFDFDGGSLSLPINNYFLTIDGLFCLAMAASSSVSIYGNIQQQNHQIVYDTILKTISFITTTCDAF